MNDSLMQNAAALRRAGQLAEAAQLYDEVLRSEPAHYGALHALGILRYQSGQLEEAERLIGRAVAANPIAADALYNRGSLLLRLQRTEDAIAAFDKAIALKPDYVEAITNRGNALSLASRHEAASDDFARAVAIRPNLAEVWANLGGAQVKLKRYPEARASFDKGLALKPDMVHAWILRGNALALSGMPEEAVASYDRALQLRSNDSDALYGRADAFLLLRRFVEAVRDYEQLLSADPSRKFALGNLVFCRLHLCDWARLYEDRRNLRSGIRSGQALAAPFPSLASGWAENPTDLSIATQMWGEQFPPSPNPLWRGERYAHEKIRLAYLSANFNDHAVARLLAGIIEHHDRSRFETTAISFGDDDSSALRARLMGAFDRFLDVRDKSDAEVAELLRGLEIDIAIDLMGFTDRCRPGILSHRPVPVRVNYLGFPGTMGMEAVDYILGDATITPDAHRGGFVEHIVQLPDCYLPSDRTRRISSVAPSRKEAGLPDSGFVFCCFNNSYKYMPETFDIWMRLLRAVDGSVLWLSQVAPATAVNLKREAQTRGIAPDRLIFASFVARDEDHLARFKLADLFLDTLPYNAHATASDALWAGLPLLTVEGETFPGRVAASLLRAIGLPELVAGSFSEYEAMGLRLARDPAALAALRGKLAGNRETHPLFDTARFTHNLEMAFTTMWRKYQNGEVPVGFTVAREARV